jgi:hypothetical protein
MKAEYTEEEIKGFVLRDLIRDGYSKCEAVENLSKSKIKEDGDIITVTYDNNMTDMYIKVYIHDLKFISGEERKKYINTKKQPEPQGKGAEEFVFSKNPTVNKEKLKAWISLEFNEAVEYKEQPLKASHKEVTGFDTIEEWQAYEKGVSEGQEQIMEAIRNWTPEGGSQVGLLLREKFAGKYIINPEFNDIFEEGAEEILSEVTGDPIEYLDYHKDSDMVNPKEAKKAMKAYAQIKVEEDRKKMIKELQPFTQKGKQSVSAFAQQFESSGFRKGIQKAIDILNQ